MVRRIRRLPNSLFASSTNLKLDGISKWNTKSLINTAGMFHASNNIDVDVSSLDVSRVTDMDRMFNYASSLNLDVSKWNMSSVTDMYAMFHASSNLNLNGISNWDTSNVINMNAMFDSSSDLINFDGIKNWDTSSVQDMYNIFQGAWWMDEVLCWNLNPNVNLQRAFCSTQGGFDCTCVSQDLIQYANLRCDDSLPKCVEKITVKGTENGGGGPDDFDQQQHDIERYNTPISTKSGRSAASIKSVVGLQSFFALTTIFGWVAFEALVL